jgi:predicted flap endonuclease-1-like 5' DNA nuclease
VKALGCRDPMALVSLQQEYVQRMLKRWTQLAAEAGIEAEKWHSPAADMPHPEPRPMEPTPTAKKVAESDIDAPPPATAAPAPANDGAARRALHDTAGKAAAEASTTPKTAAATPVDEAGDDDLTQIKGIGPKFAQTLKDHGITSYKKLASLTAKEIEELEEKLGFSGRFERENWVEQARALIAH